MSSPTLINLDIDQLQRNPYQPRKKFDPVALKSLANSITKQGLLQPIVARKTEVGYQIVAGERRWRAAQLAKVNTVPVIIRRLNDEESAIASISENTEREDLSLIEKAQAYARLSEDFKMTHREIGELYSTNEKTITHTLRLLSLDIQIQQLIENGDIMLGHAKIILSAPPEMRINLANQAARLHLSVRELENKVKALSQIKKVKEKDKDSDLKRLENNISSHLGAPTEIKYMKNSSGILSFKFSSLDEFEGLLEKLKLQSLC